MPKEQQRHRTKLGDGKAPKGHGYGTVEHPDLSSWFKTPNRADGAVSSVGQKAVTRHGNFEALDLTPWLADAILPDEPVPPDILPVWDPGTAVLEPGHEDIPKLYLSGMHTS
jgi:hypothetical protein